jgi:hypothetical protein
MQIDIDAETELKLLENSMRDFIQLVLERKYGPQWLNSLKVSGDRKKRWQERKDSETKRLPGKALDDRLLYYSDFYDIQSIVTKHWDDGFSDALKDKKLVEVYLEQMEKLRDPNAHRRELTTQQKCLIVGISGELRIRIMQYRGKGENVEAYFPKIEAIKDNLGNIYPPQAGGNGVITQQVLRVGDTLEFQITSTDPNDGKLEYSLGTNWGVDNWSEDSTKTLTLTDEYIGKNCDLIIKIRSDKPYHALDGGYDDIVWYRYTVLPVSK